MKVVTRFAPSPTGFLHIGGIRTALFSYLWAKKNNGTFILRIEDTDKDREVAGSIEHIQKSLSWLSLAWDYGPDKPGPFGSCLQSERLDIYKKYAEKLLNAGFAYPDPYTEEDVEKFRQESKGNNTPFLYRNYRPTSFEGWDGRSTLRFKVPEIKRYAWVDAVRGNLEAGEEALDDFVLLKSDGYPTYNFAHIVDDFEMGVTHIFRADEFISSTPKFLSLYEALGIAHPVFVTLPPILREDRTKKLGKRDGAKDIFEYEKEGYLPSAIINYLALVGWNPGTEQEIFSMDDLLTQFSIDQIHTAGAAFDETKLQWINKEHMLKLPPSLFIEKAKLFLSEKTRAGLSEKNLWEKIVPVMQERIQTFADVAQMDGEGEFAYFYASPSYAPDMLVWKKNPDKKAAKKHLETLITLLDALPEHEWLSEKIKEAVFGYAETEGKGNVLWPMRVALSGREKSPDPFMIAGIIGKHETEERIRNAADSL